jgi:DNA-binding protein HU-beta
LSYKFRKIGFLTFFLQKKLAKAEILANMLLFYIYNILLIMKKQDFIKTVATKAGLSQDAVSKALQNMIAIITGELKKGGEVNITGFGNFKVSKRAARNGVNPRTRQAIKIPAMKSPVFRAGKTLKEAVR